MTTKMCEECAKKECPNKNNPKYTDLCSKPTCFEIKIPPVASQPMIAKWLEQHQTRGLSSSLNGQGYRPSL